MFYSKKLKKFNKIKHCFFSRKGGFSEGIYKSLNCGRGSKDKKQNILKNLNYVSKKFSIQNKNLILMYQTHSNKVIEINKKNYKNKIRSDAMITQIKGLGLGVVTADCVPILIYNEPKQIIGCIHAGWRGAFSGIIRNTILKIKKINSNGKIYASIGPCIGRISYEVNLQFFKRFIKKSKKNIRYFSQKNEKKKLFNLRKFVSDQLRSHGVNVDHINYDTFAEKNLFFSYRRSSIQKHKDYGRCISVIKLV